MTATHDLTKHTAGPAGGCTVENLRVALTGRGIDVVDEISIDLRPGDRKSVV